MPDTSGEKWFKVHSWHIVRDISKGLGTSAMVTALCGLKQYSANVPELAADFPAGEKTCESCLRQEAKD